MSVSTPTSLMTFPTWLKIEKRLAEISAVFLPLSEKNCSVRVIYLSTCAVCYMLVFVILMSVPIIIKTDFAIPLMMKCC